MKKLFTLAMALMLSVTTALGLVGCGNKGSGGSDDANTLDIYITNLGYGYEWLNPIIESFKEQDWVKDKYGEVTIPEPSRNSDSTYTQTMIEAGHATNKFDLMFATARQNAVVFDKDSNGNPNYEDLTSLLETTVPGESVTLGQKMKSDILETSYVIEKSQLGTTTQEKHLFGMPWVDGTMGIIANRTLIGEALGDPNFEYPRTTKELTAFAKRLTDLNYTNADGKRVYAFCSASETTYWMNCLPLWWAQYEGRQGYINFFSEDTTGDYGTERFSDKGRLYALQALESIIANSTGNNHTETNLFTFTQSQGKFITGEGFMMPNGDWIENEMGSFASSSQNTRPNDVHEFMPTPIVSQIVEKLSFKNEGTEADREAKLCQIIDQIDAGNDFATAQATLSWLTEADYNKVYEARYIRNLEDGHSAYIPYYSPAKELAKDFLRYLATDEAIASYMKTNNGCASPYEYDYSKLDFELPSIHKSVMENKRTGYALPPTSTFPLCYYGGMTSFYKTANIETCFTATNANDQKTAIQIYQADVDHFSNPDEWNKILTNAGLN